MNYNKLKICKKCKLFNNELKICFADIPCELNNEQPVNKKGITLILYNEPTSLYPYFTDDNNNICKFFMLEVN